MDEPPQTAAHWLASAFASLGEPPHRDEHEALADFQRNAASTLARIVQRHRGALLADAVGMGKTRVALVAAQHLARDRRRRQRVAATICVVAPARLRDAWRRTAVTVGAGRDLEILSHTALSRGQLPQRPPAVVIVDEAHRFRNPKSKRYEALARLAVESPLIAVTATPVCNSVWDLYHLLRLFLDDRDAIDLVGHPLRELFERGEMVELLSHITVRRERAPRGHLARPSLTFEVIPYRADDDERWLWAELEPTLRRMALTLLDDDWPRQLFLEFILRRWESGPEALLASLRALHDYHVRWLELAARGRRLSRSGFSELFRDEATRLQEPMPFLLDAHSEPADAAPIAAARGDCATLSSLIARLEVVVERGCGRDQVLARLLAEPGKLVVFATYQAAAEGLYRRAVSILGARARVGLITGQGAWATGLGRSSADEVIARFAPRASGRGELAVHQSIEVLVCTDCMAEGVNLQDCGRVMLADLPDTPLRIEQRVGRLCRPGGPHHEVRVLLARPEDWGDTLGMRARLDRKLAQAELGGARFDAAASLSPRAQAPIASPLAALVTLDRLRHQLAALEPAAMTYGVTEGPVEAFWLLATLRDGVHNRLMCCRVRAPDDVEWRTAALVPELVDLAERRHRVRACAPPADLLDAARATLEARLEHLRAARLAPSQLDLDAPQRRLWRVLCDHWRAGELPRLPQPSQEALRRAVLREMPCGLERALDELASARHLSPRDRLRQVRALIDIENARALPELELVGGLWVVRALDAVELKRHDEGTGHQQAQGGDDHAIERLVDGRDHDQAETYLRQDKEGALGDAVLSGHAVA